jgi:hypothetical protein
MPRKQARGVGMKGASMYSSTTSKPLPRMITVWKSSRIASLTVSMWNSLISGMTLGDTRKSTPFAWKMRSTSARMSWLPA